MVVFPGQGEADAGGKAETEGKVVGGCQQRGEVLARGLPGEGIHHAAVVCQSDELERGQGDVKSRGIALHIHPGHLFLKQERGAYPRGPQIQFESQVFPVEPLAELHSGAGGVGKFPGACRQGGGVDAVEVVSVEDVRLGEGVSRAEVEE